MKQISIGALAVIALSAAIPAAHAGAGVAGQAGRVERGETRVDGAAMQDGARITAVGRVRQVIDADTVVLHLNGMDLRVQLGAQNRAGQERLREGDRVRVVGELVAENRVRAEQLTLLGRAPSQVSRMVVGSIRGLDREANRMNVMTNDGMVRVEWDQTTDWTRSGQPAGARDFRVGDTVRIAGRRVAGEGFLARRVVSGPVYGWRQGSVGEIVSLDSRAREAEIDFDGEVWTVRLGSAALRRNERRLELDDLRLGMDVRVAGTARPGRMVEASSLEVVRGADHDDRGRGDRERGERGDRDRDRDRDRNRDRERDRPFPFSGGSER